MSFCSRIKRVYTCRGSLNDSLCHSSHSTYIRLPSFPHHSPPFVKNPPMIFITNQSLIAPAWPLATFISPRGDRVFLHKNFVFFVSQKKRVGDTLGYFGGGDGELDGTKFAQGITFPHFLKSFYFCQLFCAPHSR